MIRAFLITAILLLAMLGPYLPGRFDASAATLSFVIQVASYASLLFVPVGSHGWSAASGRASGTGSQWGWPGSSCLSRLYPQYP
jgi:hypothetical protein